MRSFMRLSIAAVSFSVMETYITLTPIQCLVEDSVRSAGHTAQLLSRVDRYYTQGIAVIPVELKQNIQKNEKKGVYCTEITLFLINFFFII